MFRGPRVIMIPVSRTSRPTMPSTKKILMNLNLS